MDPQYIAQDIPLCDQCQTTALKSHCELCQINLCKACERKHLYDSSKTHRLASYIHKTFAPKYPKCPNHSEKHCERYCEKCDIPVCSTCISSEKHHGHKFTDILKILSSKTKDLEKDLEELDTRLYPTYKEITSDLNTEKENLEKIYEKLTTAATKRGEDWHREINIIVNKQKSEINEMKAKHLAALNKQEKEIKHITSEVKQSIFDLKKILDSNDVSLTSAYKSRNAEFRCLPPKVNVSLPSFSPLQIDTEQLRQMFGSLSPSSIITEDYGYTIKTPEAVSCPPVKPLLDKPEVITTIDVNPYYDGLYNVTCLSDEEIWTCGCKGMYIIMQLFDLQGNLLKSIKTKSYASPCDLALTRSGDVVYSDHFRLSVNIVKNDQTQEEIRLQGLQWRPCGVCNTSSGDLLVTMDSTADEQSKVVCYCGPEVKQTIQFDSNSKPLYSHGYLKYITENRNLDICVADNIAKAVVVVNQAGKLRFRYPHHASSTESSFAPVGITTDSQSQILTVDSETNYIHIIDQDGQFLRYIDNCALRYPWGLCVDTRDNLFVAEVLLNMLKKIKYM